MWPVRAVRLDVLKRTGEFLQITFADTPDIIPCALEVYIVFDVVTNIFCVNLECDMEGQKAEQC
jgi:hypothetical protein